MKAVTRFAARLLYPRCWRNRYGAEFDALLDDAPGGLANLIDVVRGGCVMRVRMSHPAIVVVGLGLSGALIAGLAAFAVPARFEAHGTMKVTGSAEDSARVPAIFNTALTRGFSAGDVSRADITITRAADSDEIQFAYKASDPRRAREVVEQLMSQTIAANLGEAEAGSRGLQLKVTTPADLPRTPSRPHLTWLAAGGFAGTIIGAVLSRRRRHS